MNLWNRIEEAVGSAIGVGIVLGSFLLWCFGIAVCWRADELFWAVVSFAMPPVGFVIGLYNFIF